MHTWILSKCILSNNNINTKEFKMIITILMYKRKQSNQSSYKKVQSKVLFGWVYFK